MVIAFSRRAATDRNGGPARGGELYKLIITDGWQWKALPWDLERSVALEQLEQVTGEPDQNAIGNGTLHISEGISAEERLGWRQFGWGSIGYWGGDS